MARRSVLLSCLLLACACGPTELALVATSDLPAQQLAAVEIAIASSDPSASPQRRCVCLSGGCSASDGAELIDGAWPLSAGLRPGRSSAPPFTVELLGYAQPSCGGTVLVSQRARARFVLHRRLLLRMALSAACVSVRCDGENTCRDGACLPIDFPVESLDGKDPLAGLDLAASADLAVEDLASPDLASGDLALLDPRGPPVVVLTDTSGMAGPPTLASTGWGYQIVVAYPNPSTPGYVGLYAHPIDAAGTLGAAFVLTALVVPALVPQVTVADGTGYVTQVINGQLNTASVFANQPGMAAVGSAASISSAAMFKAQAIIALNEGIETATTYSGSVFRRLHARPTYMFPMGANTTTLASGGRVLGMWGATGDDVAIWYDDPTGRLSAHRSYGSPPLETSVQGSSDLHDLPTLLAAAASDSEHFVVIATLNTQGSAELRYASIPIGGASIPAYQTRSFVPPLLVTATSLVFARDGGGFVLAYTDAAGLHERVYELAVGLFSAVASVLNEVRVLPVLPPADTLHRMGSLSFVASHQATGPGAGRYAWREDSIGGGGGSVIIYTMARDPARP